jgi:hypothetical protein
MMARPIFVLRLRADPGIDAVRALRALLKVALRQLGLRCVEAYQEYPSCEPGAKHEGNPISAGQDNRRNQMDVSEYLSTAFLKVGDLASGSRRVVVANVVDGKYGKPDAHFQDGTCLSLNITNLRTLTSAYGTETEPWIGKEIELYVGPVKYNGAEQDSVLVRPISPPIPFDERPAPKPKPAGAVAVTSIDDEIPF